MYQILKISTDKIWEEQLSNLLLVNGASGISTEGSYLIHNSIVNGIAEAWDEDSLDNSDAILMSAYFDEENNCDITNEIQDIIKIFKEENPLCKLEFKFEPLINNDWQDAWRKYYKPMRIGKNIIICPEWEPYEKQANDIVIYLDPGLAFGTGDHPTTSTVLTFIEDQVKDGMTMVDVGCGSGILSIGASLLGARRIVAVDKDFQAIKVTNGNIALNEINGDIECFQSDMSKVIDEQFDIVVANIIAAVIIDLLPKFKLMTKENGLLITGGIIKERKDEVIDHIKENGYEIVDVRETGEWVTILSRSI